LKKRQKNNLVKVLLALALVVLFINLKTKPNGQEKAEDDYEVYVNQIVNTFASEMKEKYGLRCCGSGGSMPYNVEEISVIFYSIKKPTLEEARILEVNLVERLIELVNNHEKIRPYLAEYPFASNRAEVSISFYSKDGLRHTDGNVTRVSLIRGKLFFRKAEKTVEETLSGKKYDDYNLITLLEEPYELALEKVKKANKLIYSTTDNSILEEKLAQDID